MSVYSFSRVESRQTLCCKYNGKLILEIDPIQKSKVIDILKKNGFNCCKIFKDYSQKERFIVSTKNN